LGVYLLGLGFRSAVADDGVVAFDFLCVFACDDAVAAVAELPERICFLGDPSGTVGPTDCERATVKCQKKNLRIILRIKS
jgi:hypothetical protein